MGIFHMTVSPPDLIWWTLGFRWGCDRVECLEAVLKLVDNVCAGTYLMTGGMFCTFKGGCFLGPSRRKTDFHAVTLFMDQIQNTALTPINRAMKCFSKKDHSAGFLSSDSHFSRLLYS